MIAPARKARTGRIGLRATGDGFGTPPFDDGTSIGVRGDRILHGPSGSETTVPIRTLRAAAAALGVALTPDPGVGHDLPPFEPDAALDVDPGASLALGAWYAEADRVLAVLHTHVAPGTMDEVQLWPEHFDLASVVEASPGRKVNVGFSAGDGFSDEPYVYVGPHDLEGLTGELWNAPFGAVLARSRIAAAPDPPAAALGFLRRGLAAAASPTS